MNDKTSQPISNGIMANLAKSLNTKRKFETYLNSMVRTLVLTASKRSDYNEVTPSTTASRSFFEQASEAKAFLYHKFNIQLKIPIYISTGMATTIYAGFLFWRK